MHKRKRRAVPRLHWLTSNRENEGKTRPAATLCVEAHEADLVVGQEAAALMLEAPSPVDGTPTKGERGSGLIRWDAEGVWVDRYDARLLLSALPSCSRQTDILTTPTTPPSPSGWSDLPSDAEDTFFLSAAEAADLRHEKRRRLLDAAHDARLRALRATERPGRGAGGYEDEDDPWGGSDEEPGTAQHELMRRTAAHLHASPNRAQLEARILANHGADARFAFLRGRWRRAWARAREEAREEAERAAQERENEKGKAGLMGLSGYGDSDSDEGEAEGGNKKTPSEVSAVSADEAAKMEARRARAREWAAKRRAERTEEQSS